MVLTWLCVPGDRPERFARAAESGADAVILDLKDTVTLQHKRFARAAVADFLTEPPAVPVLVQVNELGSPEFFADLDAIADAPGLAGLRLPRVESAAQVSRVADLSRKELHVLIESARGLEMAFEIATVHRSITAIGLGEAELRSELGPISEEGLVWARGRMVVAARAAGLPAPAMPVYPRLSDLDGLRESCRAGRRQGFVGRVAMHPLQLPVIVESFRPAPDEVARSRELLAAAAGAAVSDSGTVVLPDGHLADRAMVAAARHTVELAARCELNRAP
jgi:citrate lyase subunit beta / citryl-CoA lyase